MYIMVSEVQLWKASLFKKLSPLKTNEMFILKKEKRKLYRNIQNTDERRK